MLLSQAVKLKLHIVDLLSSELDILGLLIDLDIDRVVIKQLSISLGSVVPGVMDEDFKLVPEL